MMMVVVASRHQHTRVTAAAQRSCFAPRGPTSLALGDAMSMRVSMKLCVGDTSHGVIVLCRDLSDGTQG